MTIAHIRTEDGTIQTVSDHLLDVASLTRINAAKLELGLAGELLGLVHDLGKYSENFQVYIKSAEGLLNPDIDEEYVDATALKGKIDHSTAGAQIIWEAFQGDQLRQIVGQIFAMCVASHHSGLIDCIGGGSTNYGKNIFSARMLKADLETHLSEVRQVVDDSISSRIEELVECKELVEAVKIRIGAIGKKCGDPSCKSIVAQAHLALLTRFLFSCLIDADRQNTAEFEKPYLKTARMTDVGGSDWKTLSQRLEAYLSKLPVRNRVDSIRSRISAECLQQANKPPGVFSLSVPTGGGKTYASLRFALKHAERNQLQRIFYIIPYTSIIEQNAEDVRNILENDATNQSIVLEHHSNLTPECQGWREKMLTENWDAPIVFTTMVQFLESLFGSGTRGARRMHQLAKSVIIFDEIQSLPVNCVHLFNNAINFLREQCGSTAVMCTATQPLLHEVNPTKGCLNLLQENEMIGDVDGLFSELRRVEVIDTQKKNGWKIGEIAELAVQEMLRSGSCLAIVNTKASARLLYEKIANTYESEAFHLSTSMCPSHRKETLKVVRDRLENDVPTICVSTQLIEAGVDVDFGCVIRYLAGLNSIAQAAGRCNRNGRSESGPGKVYVINPADENLGPLEDIKIGIEKTRRVFDDFREFPERFNNDLIGPKSMEWFYKLYFHDRASEMSYPVGVNVIARDDSILNLLSCNTLSKKEYTDRNNERPPLFLQQAFMTASKAFKAIDSPTRGIVVPHGAKGREIIGLLCSDQHGSEIYDTLRKAQQFTVNVFDNVLQRLIGENAVARIREDIDVLYLNERFYHPRFGLITEPESQMEFCNG